MRLLVVSHACATAVNQQLYAELTRVSGWDVTLVVPENWRDEYGRTCPADRWSSFAGELLTLPVRRSGDIVLHSYKRSFAKLIRQVAPDAVYVNHEPYAVATAQVYWGNRAAGGRPIGFYSCQNISKHYPPPFRWTEAWVLRSSAFFFPISKTVEHVFRRKGYRGPSAVLPLAIDGELYRPRAAEDTRREFGVKCDAVLLGYVGRLVPAKGLRTLIDALTLIATLPWRLVIVGSGEMEDELRERVKTAGFTDRVCFPGFVPHDRMSYALSAIDVLVLPSETQSNWREQFGRVLLEAMACGTPVIGSDSGEIPTLIHDTGGGLVFRERDPASLADRLRSLISDAERRRDLARAGGAAVAERYSVAGAARAMAETLGHALQGCERGSY